MTATTPLAWAPDDPIRSRMIFVSGTECTATANQLTPALELYDGGCVPQLQQRLAAWPEHRARIRVLCAGYGVVHADTRLLPDREPMTAQRCAGLRAHVEEKLLREFARDGVPREVMVLADPLYAELVIGVFWIPNRRPHTALHTTAPAKHWPQAAPVLDQWGWP